MFYVRNVGSVLVCGALGRGARGTGRLLPRVVTVPERVDEFFGVSALRRFSMME